MLRKLSTALLLTIVSCSFAHAQAQNNSPANSPINESKKAWVIRYGTEANSGNKRKDLAIVLKLREGSGDKKFTGTLLRFDIARNSKYLRADGPTGKIAISGKYTELGSGNSARRPVRITGAGTYVTDTGKVRIVLVKGLYHPGNLTNSRVDDRLSVRIQVKNIENNSGANGNAPTDNPDVNSIDVSNEIFVVFQQQNPPCDDEPDTDVLMEESVSNTDEGIDDLEDFPVDP